MAGAVHSTTRRGFLGHALVAAPIVIAVPAAALAASQSDPLLDLMNENRRVCAALDALPGDLPDDHPLWDEDRKILRTLREDCPQATTREGALEALRYALKVEVGTMGEEDVISVISAALVYFETNS